MSNFLYAWLANLLPQILSQSSYLCPQVPPIIFLPSYWPFNSLLSQSEGVFGRQDKNRDTSLYSVKKIILTVHASCDLDLCGSNTLCLLLCSAFLLDFVFEELWFRPFKQHDLETDFLKHWASWAQSHAGEGSKTDSTPKQRGTQRIFCMRRTTGGRRQPEVPADSRSHSKDWCNKPFNCSLPNNPAQGTNTKLKHRNNKGLVRT